MKELGGHHSFIIDTLGKQQWLLNDATATCNFLSEHYTNALRVWKASLAGNSLPVINYAG